MALDLFSLEGRVALITGGSRGIGKMIARGFIDAGARKVYISSRKQADCDATAAKVNERGLVNRDVISGPTGLRQVFVKDPDGNMVEFIGPSKNAAERKMEPVGTHGR